MLIGGGSKRETESKLASFCDAKTTSQVTGFLAVCGLSQKKLVNVCTTKPKLKNYSTVGRDDCVLNIKKK